MHDHMAPHYQNRVDAGKRLAEDLNPYRDCDVVVFAIPRGGIPVAVEVAKKLKSPLDIVITRKITIPFNTDAGYGAATEDGTLVLNQRLIEELNLTTLQIKSHVEEVRAEIVRRTAVYRARMKPVSVAGKTAVIVDDGLASGYTMKAAIQSVRKRGAETVVAAVPVASASAWEFVKGVADLLVCPVVAYTDRFAVAGFYRQWRGLTDETVIMALERYTNRGRRHFNA